MVLRKLKGELWLHSTELSNRPKVVKPKTGLHPPVRPQGQKQRSTLSIQEAREESKEEGTACDWSEGPLRAWRRDLLEEGLYATLAGKLSLLLLLCLTPGAEAAVKSLAYKRDTKRVLRASGALAPAFSQRELTVQKTLTPTARGLRGGSAAANMCFSCGWPRFDSQHPHGHSQPFASHLKPARPWRHQVCMWCTYLHTSKIFIHRINKYQQINKTNKQTDLGAPVLF